jgi:hypothetical protein
MRVLYQHFQKVKCPILQYDEQSVNSGTLSTKLSQDIRNMHETGSFSLGE